ncbi:N-acetylglucosamine kinase [Pedobacter sp.]|uniref:N-acetylglucosamine kinase n=1 Tax=Pedobacter sp. TaxID=1411316 RepID=UPI003D7F20B6
MILIADSGSTKTDWCLLDEAGTETYFTTEGYNPFYADKAYISRSIKNSIPSHIDTFSVSKIHFYGAGCQDDQTEVMCNILQEVFENADEINAEVDLLAAARGLLGNQPGFAAILGTGTNTCLYDGRGITHNIDSLGFILGDEGSGAAIGKQLLSDYLRNKMPASVRELFLDTYGLKPDEVIHKVYSEPFANRFCAGFTKFLKQPGVDESYSHQLVKHSFTALFQNLVSCYPSYSAYTFNCIGSVGYHFQDVLSEVLDEFGMKQGKILSSLIRELVSYHKMKVNSI